MVMTCGNCIKCDLVPAELIEELQANMPPLGYCIEAMEYVCTDWDAEQIGCEDTWVAA